MAEAPNLEARLAELHTASFGWALACCGRDRDEASDVVQETYAKVLSGKAQYREESSFKTWLFGVVRLTAIEHRRWRFFRNRVVSVAEPIEPPPPSSSKLDKAEAEGLARALAKISERQREVLHLVFYQEMTIAEAAAVMGVALGTARLHYERGKAALLQILTKEGIRFP